MKKLVIIGASGHGKVIADMAKKSGYQDIIFLDDNPDVKNCGGYPVLGDSSMMAKVDGDYIVGIGNAKVRKMIQERIIEAGRNIATIIHPSAIIGENVSIGVGTVIMAGAVVNPGVSIGNGCIINTCASVDHDCILQDYVHISVGVHLAGTVLVGEQTWIGIGAVVSNNIEITGGCTIGAGAVVVDKIEESGTYVGVPARKMK